MSSLDEFSEDDVCEVSRRWLRRLFRELDFIHQGTAGDLCTEVIRENHPSPASSGERDCTRSQRIVYKTKDVKALAQAHQYLRPDGTIGGASGKPDPKLILD